MSASSQLRIITALGIILILAFLAFENILPKKPVWSEQEIQILKSLWIGSLPATADDKSNKLANNLKIAEFGRQLPPSATDMS